MSESTHSRRKFLTATAGTALLVRAANPAVGRLVIGFVYNGPKNDLGYNQAHADGRLALKGISNVQAIEESNVPETVAVEESMRDMIHQDGARVIMATSYGFLDPFVLRLAREYPEVQFFHCGGGYRDGVDPKNVGIYFGFIDEVEFLAGMAAGLTTRTNRMGFVAAKPIPQVLRNINSFMLGARSVNPKVTMRVVFTGDWVLPVREAEASSSLVDQGVDVLTGHTGSPRVIVQIAERRGVFATGYQFNQSVLAPHGFLTGAEWAWGVVYQRYAQMIHEGKSVMAGTIPRRMSGTLKDDFCRLSPFGPAVTPAVREVLRKARTGMLDGSLEVYRGPLRDNTGRAVVPDGKTIKIEDPWLDRMNWLLEGIQGQVNG
jgi:simple sugar transport system substrate-binding protein